MPKQFKDDATVTVRLKRIDVGQIIDGLTERAELYERTARYHEQDGYLDADAEDSQDIAEVNDADEARQIAQHFRDIIATLEAAL